MIKDVVCGMEIKGDNSELQLKYEGKIYNFCSASCKSTFEGSPSSYVKKEEKDPGHSC